MLKKGRVYRYIVLLIAVSLVVTVLSGCGKTKRKTKELEIVTMGIDVARYQGTIDWQQVAASGVDFVMVRVGYRTMEDGRITEVQLHPVNLGMELPRSQKGRPVLSHDESWLEYLAKLSKPYGTNIEIKDGVGYIKF